MPIPYWIRSIKKDNNKDGKIEEKEENKLDKFSSDSLVSKTRECISQFCVGIADRTIALQFHQFKTPRKETNELILENRKTYNLSEAEVEKYFEAVKKISEKDLINLDRDINVDLGGFSLEIAQDLGMDYLRKNYILVSTKQRECGTIRKYTSFASSLIRKLFDTHYKTMEQILLGEALIGRIYTPATKDMTIKIKDIEHSSLLSIMTNNPESIFNIEMTFDTPNNAISRLKSVREDERKLLNDVDKLKDRIFLKHLLDNIENITIKHGSLERIPDKEIILKDKVDYYKLNFSSLDVYCMRSKNGTPVFVYFDSDDIMKESYRREDSIVLNGKDINSVNILIDLEMVGYSPYLGLERAVNIIVRNRRENLRKFIEKDPGSSEEAKKLFSEELMREEKVPEKVKELLSTIESLVKNGRDKNFFYSLGRSKIYMAYPLIQNEILYEVLSRMENDEIKSSYINTSKFIEIVSKMGNGQLIEFMKKILDSLEFKEEYNPTVNFWLNENRNEVCKKLGIRFIMK